MLYKVDNLPHTAASQLPNKSFVWQEIGGYLSPAECAHMQGVSKHFYKFLTQNRLCQSNLVGRTYVFTQTAKSVMLYDRNTQEARLIENPCLDVSSNNARSVVVNKALIVFEKGSPVVAQKYTCFDDPANTVKSRLPTLPSHDYLQAFSVCKLANNSQIILSGGANESVFNSKVSAQVHALDTLRWKWKRLADLNIARSNHSSTALGQATYVACGFGDRGFLNSVERLEMGGIGESQAWTVIDIPQLTPRKFPSFSQIGPDQLCILGGRGVFAQDTLSDGAILNLNTQEVTATNPASQIKFACISESFMMKQGLLLSLVCDTNYDIQLIRYSQADNAITSLRNCGSSM